MDKNNQEVKKTLEDKPKDSSASKGCLAGLSFGGGVSVALIIAIIVILLLCCLGSLLCYYLIRNIYDFSRDYGTAEQISKDGSIGEYVTAKNLQWKAKSAEDLGKTLRNPKSKYMEPVETSGKFIKVIYAVKNTGEDSATISEPDLVDSTSREYDGYYNSSLYMEENHLWYASLNPGIEKEYGAIFDISEDATGLMLQVRGGGLLDEELKYIDLGI